MWLDLIVEYAAGFSFGLFIFQSLFMKEVMGGTYWENVKKSFLPEFISMDAMMAGMAPVMSLLMMGSDMRAMDPAESHFLGGHVSWRYGGFYTCLSIQRLDGETRYQARPDDGATERQQV